MSSQHHGAVRLGFITSYNMLLYGILAVTLSIPALAHAEPHHVKSSTSASHGRGTFATPAVESRPKFRYWLPDASVEPAVVASDVKAAGDVGMGGMELLGYYLYGGPPSNGAGRGLAAPVDWATYGFGTQAWSE